MMIIKYIKQLIHSEIAHHLSADAQSVPQAADSPPTQPSQFLLLCIMLYVTGYLFCQFGSAVPAMSTSQVLVHPQPSQWQGSM